MISTRSMIKAKWVVAAVGLLPFLYGTAPASSSIQSAIGTNHGLELRDAKSTLTPGNPPTLNNGAMCAGAQGLPWDANDSNPFGNTFKVTGLASYTYPLDEPEPTPNVGAVEIVGRDAFNVAHTYQGPVSVTWEADTVWDGPLGTTRDMINNSNPDPSDDPCDYGWEWPIQRATITGVNPVTDNEVSCTDARVGSQRDPDSLTAQSGSAFSRFVLSSTSTPNTNGNAGTEVVRLVFPNEKCKIRTGANWALLAGDNVFSLEDHAHAFCHDLNLVEAAMGDDGSEVGVTHCVSNYVFS